MSKIAKPRGTYDLFGKEMDDFNKISEVSRQTSKLYNFNEIVTPIFEHKELFVRNIGENSDIVTKEFYDFFDKGNREIVLRPENTIGVIRSVVENKLLHKNPLPLKYFYIGPMFRYERPQSGRNRQFNQFGIESIGIKNEYEQVETIVMAQMILNSLHVKNYELNINYIGSLETREKWINDLKKYFEQYKDDLTEDSLARLEKNPLRILDDKVDGKKDFVINSPKVDKYLTDKEKNEWKNILDILKSLNIKFKVDETLVRGLDYYDGFVFEFVSLSKKLLGQSTIIGGGKYTNLTKELGDDNYDCIGFAMGIERMIIAMNDENPEDDNKGIDIYLLTCKLDEKDKIKAFQIMQLLRENNYKVLSNFNLDKMDKGFKYAEKFNPNLILILGKNEIDNNEITVKCQRTKTESKISINNLLNELKKYFGKE